MTLVDAFTILASVLAAVGFGLVAAAQFQSTWQRILTELDGFKWLAAAAFVALMAALMHASTNVFG